MTNDNVQHQRGSTQGANSEPATRTLQPGRAGSFQFAIFADEIATIVAWREPTPLPKAPKSVLGVVSIQGRMLTVLDLAALRGLEAASNETDTKQLIALRGDEQLALAVDALGEPIPLFGSDLDPTPATGDTLLLGVLHREGADLCILNAKELFPSAIQGRERRRRRF
jgi:purine-binding chemotaxis protein CheW